MRAPTWWTTDDTAIWRLAIPALGALIAEPLYILADTAVVGRLGTPQLGGLSLASQILLITAAVFTFLAYGTTSSVSRLLGAGRERDAAVEAVGGLWLAALAGAAFGLVTWWQAPWLIRLLGGRDDIADHAVTYLRVSTLGIPALLLMLAGVGYLRGQQDTVRPLIVAIITAVGNLVLEVILIFGLDYGIGASALATVVFQWVGALIYVAWIANAVRRFDVSLWIDRSVLRRLAVAGFDLFVRTLSLRGSFAVGTWVAASFGPVPLASHEITFALWTFAAFVLDAVAIAGQSMVGSFLGAAQPDRARSVGSRIIAWGLGLGVGAALIAALTRTWLPHVFTADPEVIATTATLLVVLAVMQPVNGIAFALDGVLIGAGDLRFLAWAMAGAGLVFVPLALIVATTEAGITWLWITITVFMAVRAASLWLRFRGDRWLVLGAGDYAPDSSKSTVGTTSA